MNSKIIGLVYLANSQSLNPDPLHACELNMGIIIDSHFRRCGWASQAIQRVLEEAFKDEHCTRIQAVVVDGPLKHAALNMLMKSYVTLVL
jgi:RimJ/RimL family protein N-acetyltransferase